MIFVQILLVWLIIGCFWALIVEARPVLRTKNLLIHVLAYIPLIVLWPLVVKKVMQGVKEELSKNRHDDNPGNQ